MPPPRPPEPPPTPEELKRALPALFGIAAQCSTYHRAFALFYPAEAATGTTVHHHGQMLQVFNALSEATLMFIRKSAEFFKPQGAYDRADTLHSYQFPGYSGQGWIVPRETYEEFHKRVGHLTIQEVRHGKVSWPMFELTMQALNQWADFFAAMATEYASDAETAGYCVRCAGLIRHEAASVEREALQSRASDAPPPAA